MTKLVLGGLLAASLCTCAHSVFAQSTPNLSYGQTPTAGQWNSYFASKQDALGFRPLNRAGDTMTGVFYAAPSTNGSPSINMAVGVPPNAPANGDVWVTSSGFFVKAAGITYNLAGGAVTCGQMPALIGDVTSSANSCTTTLAMVNSTPGTYGSASMVPVLTIGSKGLTTAASATPVIAPAGTLSGATLNATVVNSNLATFAAGAAASNVGTLGGALAGSTLPNPTIANAYVTGAMLATSAAAINLGAPIGTTGATIGLNNANKTDSGNNTYNGTNSHTGVESFTTSPTVPTPAVNDNTSKAAPTAMLVRDYAALSSANTFTAKQVMPATTTGAASINLPPGTAPTSPVNGDLWTTSAGLYARINGVTIGPYMASGGATRVLLNTLTASNTPALQDTTSISGSYTNYVLECNDLSPVTTNQNINLQVYQAGAYSTSGYSGVTYLGGGSPTSVNPTSQVFLCGSTANTPGQACSVSVRFANPTSSGKTNFNGTSMHSSSTVNYADIIGNVAPAGAIGGFQIFATSGNINSGSCKLYGNN